MRSPLPSLIPPKPVKSRGIKEIPPRTPLTLEHQKPQNRAPYLTDLGEESNAQERRRVPTNFPHKIPKSKVSKTHQENHQERAPKITTKNNWEQHNKALRTTPNHLYIPRRFIQGLACRPIIQPSHKISP
jgi:hypothetical protein